MISINTRGYLDQNTRSKKTNLPFAYNDSRLNKFVSLLLGKIASKKENYENLDYWSVRIDWLGSYQ